MAYYQKRNDLTYEAYTGNGSATDAEAWYAAQDANYVKQAETNLGKAFTPSYDVFSKFVTDYAKKNVDKLSEWKKSRGYTSPYILISDTNKNIVNSMYNRVISGETISEQEKNSFYSTWNDIVNKSYNDRIFASSAVKSFWDNRWLSGDNAYAGNILSKLQAPISAEMETWNNQQNFYQNVLNKSLEYQTLLTTRQAEEAKRQQTIQAETEAKTAARKNGHQTQTEVFKDAAELMYGSKAAEEETTGSGITPGVSASGLTLSGTNTTGGKLSGTSGTANNPVSRREKARRGLLGGVA